MQKLGDGTDLAWVKMKELIKAELSEDMIEDLDDFAYQAVSKVMTGLFGLRRRLLQKSRYLSFHLN
jgi:hypothetical protein